MTGQCPISLNIQMQTPGLDQEKVFRLLVQLNPAAVIIMDNRSFAIRVKKAIPACDVTARDNFPGGVMDNIHHDHTPQQAIAHYVNPLDDHPSLLGTGVRAYFENETDWSEDHLQWELSVAQGAFEVELPVLLINGSVGQPEPDLINSGRLDDILRWASVPEHDCVIGLHEGGFNEHDPLEAWDDATKTGWLTGRVWFWVRRCRDIGIPVPYFICSEWTMGGSEGSGMKGVQAYMEYLRSQGYGDPQKRLYEVMVEVWDRVYAPMDGHMIGLCWYCAGHVAMTTPNGIDPLWWLPWDILEHAPKTLEMLANHDWLGQVNEPGGNQTEPPGKPVKLTMPWPLRFRDVPNGVIMAQIITGDTVYLTGAPVYPGPRYDWHEAWHGNLLGWFANVDGMTADPPLPIADRSAILNKEVLRGLQQVRVNITSLIEMVEKAQS